ncbi:hypothetical protein BKA62DRAFT_723980 [Auriculariales sp. MPI-PUGE-AT-0066]|nr:hypothetical protein BKA62DRAFT_723980 [Auriculariales sp. MPI-PUGE-AT-0066]
MPSDLPQGQKAEPEAVIDRFLSESADSAPGPRNGQSASSALLEISHGRRSRYDQLLNSISRGLATIEDVPDEVLSMILRLVDLKDLSNASLVSHRWNCVAATASLWSVVDLDQLRTSDRMELNAVLSKSQRSPLTFFSSSKRKASPLESYPSVRSARPKQNKGHIKVPQRVDAVWIPDRFAPVFDDHDNLASAMTSIVLTTASALLQVRPIVIGTWACQVARLVQGENGGLDLTAWSSNWIIARMATIIQYRI